MSFNHLTQEDRHHIYALKAIGKRCSEIAQVLGKHKSSIGRELRRNQGANKFTLCWQNCQLNFKKTMYRSTLVMHHLSPATLICILFATSI